MNSTAQHSLSPLVQYNQVGYIILFFIFNLWKKECFCPGIE